MKNKSFVLITLTAIAINLVFVPLLNQATHAQSEVDVVENSDRVTFYCGEIPDQAGGENIPATVAWVPQREAKVAIIAWKSNYIPQWDAQKRCETVSPKFQAFYEDGRLEYLTTGENQGYDIICAAVETGQPCKAEDQLFQVKANNDPEAVLTG
ncbi:MAG: COP23 domain-containing protein [Waterburya sp.]